MVIKEYTKDQQSKLTFTGRFDFSAHKDFRSAYQKLLDAKAKVIVLDLNGVEYLDSSALGMLLQLKDKADAIRTKIVIESRNDFVNDILATANFQKIFEMKK
ncbi:STAS domain-containing protein [Oceanospirillum sp. HFRX-1_2]